MNSKQVTISQTSGCLGKQDEEYILVGFCQPDITRVTWGERGLFEGHLATPLLELTPQVLKPHLVPP